MRGHETDPLDAVDLLDILKKTGKGHVLSQALAVGIDVLAQQHDLDHAVCGKLLDLADDLLRLPALLASPDIGNDAVGAEIVAAEHDIDAALKGVSPL